jgi:hypothetical protein
MMSVHEAEPGDLYVDHDGKLWRVVSVCGEPTVTVEEVENPSPRHPPVRRSGGVSGGMWMGWKRIHRPEPKRPEPRPTAATITRGW